MTISKQTALDIALAHREIETATGLLADIATTLSKNGAADIRDTFGRPSGGLQLGVPSGRDSHRLFNVPWQLAKPILEAHIAQQYAMIAALSEKARIELEATDRPRGVA